MNISITGNLGSGKSSICAELNKSGYEIVSAGSIFRDIAKEKKISVSDLNQMAKDDSTLDKQIDDRTILLGQTKDMMIFDCRLAWHFVPGSFKVLVTVDPYEAAKRVFFDKRRQAESYETLEEAYTSLKNRTMNELNRYKKLYNLDYLDKSNYDLVIDSTNLSPKEIADVILLNVKKIEEQKRI